MAPPVTVPVWMTRVKVLFFETWMVYPLAPVTSPQSKVGRRDDTVLRSGGLVSVGGSSVVRN